MVNWVGHYISITLHEFRGIVLVLIRHLGLSLASSIGSWLTASSYFLIGSNPLVLEAGRLRLGLTHRDICVS